MGSREIFDEAPRRWSIRERAERFHPGCDLLRRTIVRLDGVPQRDVRSWDCETGELARLARDEEGRVKIDGREVIEERLAGVVTVELAASFAAARAAR